MVSQSTTLLNGRVKLSQSIDGLRASMDSVLLAAALSAKAGETILDMGCGSGAVGLCVNERLKDLNLNIYGVDVQDAMVDLALENALNNGIVASSTYKTGDIHDKHLFTAEAFDHIVMNPPYYKQGERRISPDQAREKAYTGDLEIWLSSALHWVRQGGSVCLIHRADKLGDILSLAQGRFGAIEIWPVHSAPTEPAIRVIIRMLRNRKTPLKLHSAIVLIDAQGQETSVSKSILRDGAGLI